MESTSNSSRLAAVLAALVAVLLVALGYFIRKEVTGPAGGEETIKVDTLYICDTIRLTEPVYVSTKVVDTMLVAVCDTVVQNDTVWLHLPRQQRKYVTPYYNAWVSGYNPLLDSIQIFQKTKYVTKEIIKEYAAPRWSFSVTAGPSLLVTPSGKAYGGVGVTAGVSYRFGKK